MDYSKLIVVMTLFCSLPALLLSADVPLSSSAKCVPLEIPACSKLGYSSTVVPNILSQDSQEKARIDVDKYKPLMAIGCSSKTTLLICSAYAPQCSPSGTAIPPCRELCESVKRGCETLVKMFGHEWPGPLECATFPSKSENTDCIFE